MTPPSPDPPPTFTFLTCLHRAWQVVRDHWLPLLLAKFLCQLLTVAAACITFTLSIDLADWSIAIAALTAILIGSALEAGYLKLCLGLCEHGTLHWRSLFTALPLAAPIAIAAAAYIAFGALGACLLIIPGIIFLTRFSLYGLVLVDQRTSPVQSLYTSSKLLRGYAWYPLGFFLIVWLADSLVTVLKSIVIAQAKSAPALQLLAGSSGLEVLILISLCVLYLNLKTRGTTA